MNSTLLKSIVNSSLKELEDEFVKKVELRYRTDYREGIDGETGYPIYNYPLHDFCIINAHILDVKIKSLKLSLDLTKEDNQFLYSEFRVKLLEFAERLTNFKEFSFENGQIITCIAELNERRDSINGLLQCVEYCDEELKQFSSNNNSIPDEEIVNKHGFSKKEVFVFFKELGLFETMVFKKLSPKKRDMILSILLNSDVDYAKQLYNLNSNKYSKDLKNGIPEKSVLKVKNEFVE